MTSHDLVQYLSASQIAALVGVSTKTIYEWKKKGYLPPSTEMASGCVRWNRKTIEEWITSKETK